MAKNKDPELQDEVKNINNYTRGVVIAKYKVGDKTYLDVESAYKIHFMTPIENWEVVTEWSEENA